MNASTSGVRSTWRPLFSLAKFVATICFAGLAVAADPPPSADDPWPRHVIDASSRGADGIRLTDVNGDGRADIATGWEEGGKVRLCFQPRADELKKPWPSVTVGEVGSPEDAVAADLDGDGRWDVISSCEGKTNCLFVHWGPEKERISDGAAWQTTPIATSRDLGRWMFCLPLDLDGKPGLELICGSKGSQAAIGLFSASAAGPRAGSWGWRPWYRAGWIMSLLPADMDGDGDLDVLASDRKGAHRGVLWLENPGRAGLQGAWREHRVGNEDDEAMFLDYADLDEDGLKDVVVATANAGPIWHRRLRPQGDKWESIAIPQPGGVGTGKSVAAGDIDGDGRLDLVLSCEKAVGDKSGVVWLSRISSEKQSPSEWQWQCHELSGPAGTKFDRVELLDLDRDGDLDVLACEEVENLGLFWYENPRQ